MHTFTVVRSNSGGRPLAGAATRKYRAENAREAGRMYAAAEGIPDPMLWGFLLIADADLYTFTPGATAGARITVRVEVA